MKMSEAAFVALGSNLGNSVDLVRRAISSLARLSVAPVQASSLWQSDPVDCPPGSPPFINAVAALFPRPEETPHSLLRALRAMETEFGRTPKTVVNEARVLDLDLIAFGSLQIKSEELVLPHPRAHGRAFVLAPLSEIAPDLVLPGQTRTASQLLGALKTVPGLRRL